MVKGVASQQWALAQSSLAPCNTTGADKSRCASLSCNLLSPAASADPRARSVQVCLPRQHPRDVQSEPDVPEPHPALAAPLLSGALPDCRCAPSTALACQPLGDEGSVMLTVNRCSQGTHAAGGPSHSRIDRLRLCAKQLPAWLDL